MQAKQPNILIFFTDMQRADTIHALGNEVIRTPNLDRLVREGTAFTNCFSPCPVCIPARCCMQYGLYPQKTKLFDNGIMPPDNDEAYPAILGRAEYRTHSVGKCHFSPDRKSLRGFQSRKIQEECTSDPEKDDYVAWLQENGYDYYESHGARGEMYYIPQVSTLPAEAHPSQWIGNESIRFLRDQSSSKQPWCLFSSFVHPHPPFAPPKPWHKLYRPNQMPHPFAPENSADLHTWINRHQNRYKWRDQGIDRNLIRTIRAYYYATISFVDYQIGRICQTLDDAGQLDNTLILFTSDHGEHLGDLNCFGKRSMQDPSSKVPMLARWPGHFPADRRCATAVSLVDVLPTVIRAGGSMEKPDLDGEDLVEIAGRPDSDRIVFSQFGRGPKGLYMAVNREWKYVYSAGDRKEWLFHRSKDPLETVNLAADSGARSIKTALKKNLLERMEKNAMNDAFISTGAGLDWMPYDPLDQSYLQDPDAKLLIQDYPSYELKIPGYHP